MMTFGLPEFFKARSNLLSGILYGKNPWDL